MTSDQHAHEAERLLATGGGAQTIVLRALVHAVLSVSKALVEDPALDEVEPA